MHQATKQPSNQALVVFALATVAIAACRDATGIKAQFNNLEAKPTVYAMNGTPVTLPAAIAVRSVSAVRIDANFLFDLAFDIDSAGGVQVYPLSRVASELVGTHRVGLQVATGGFASILKAPAGGYVYDSVFTLPIGKTLLVDVIEENCSTSFLGVNIRAKLSIDSVNTTSRAIFLHILSNPNCGFRALNQGEPKE